MSDPEFPYETHLDVMFGPLQEIDVHALAAAVTHPWWNQTLCRVNQSVVRLAVVRGTYHWHHHEVEDEFFFVVEGALFVDLEDRTVRLRPGQGLTVPRGVRHRTRADVRTIMLMVEADSIVPTGSGAVE
jgi:mannose-6-phosphate isomerase-like protein (cupin superfamily)